jgi:hypothetical protein
MRSLISRERCWAPAVSTPSFAEAGDLARHGVLFGAELLGFGDGGAAALV